MLASEAPPDGLWTPLRVFGDRPPVPPYVAEGPVQAVPAAAQANSNLWAISLQNIQQAAQNGTPVPTSAPTSAPVVTVAASPASGPAAAPAPEPPASDF